VNEKDRKKEETENTEREKAINPKAKVILHDH